MTRKSISIILLSILLPFAAGVYYYASNPINNHRVSIGDSFPGIPEGFTGKTWIALVMKPTCSHCVQQMADFASLPGPARKHFPMVAFSLSDTATTANFLSAYAVPF